MNGQATSTANSDSPIQHDDLIAMVVHDLRSPLSGLLGLLSIMKSEDDPRTRAMYAVEGERTVQSLLVMVNTILDTHKMEAGRLIPQRVSENIVDVARTVVRRFRVLSGFRALTFDSAHAAIVAPVDAPLIERVLQNLIVNAIEHTHPITGGISVTVTGSRQSVRIRVADNGHGIPPEYHERIFEKFGTVGSPHRSVGLGLPFCRMVVEGHDGEIHVSSNPGGGSQFWIDLPRESA